jgi:hypothetical protein
MVFAPPSLLVLALASTATVAAAGPSVKEILKRKLINQKLPETPGEDWTSLENGMEFLPAANLSPLAQHHMRRLTNGAYSIGGVYEQAIVDGSETYYDGKNAMRMANTIPSSKIVEHILNFCPPYHGQTMLKLGELLAFTSTAHTRVTMILAASALCFGLRYVCRPYCWLNSWFL